MRRAPSFSPHQRVTRWTWYECLLCCMSALLLVGAFGTEAYRWANPPSAPAAARLEAETPTIAQTPTISQTPMETETSTLPDATSTPAPTSTEIPPTDTPPTATPVPPDDTAVPTPFSNEQPLALRKSASVASATPGQHFRYVLVLSNNSIQPRAAQLRDYIDAQLEIMGVVATNGTCQTGAEIVCALRVQHAAPATVEIEVRVRVAAVIGSKAVSQALAQDDLNNTVASDPVTVLVVAPSPTSTDTPSATVPTPTIAPQAVAAPDATTSTPVSSTKVPTPAAPAATRVPLRNADAPVPTATLAATAQPQATEAPTASASDAPTPTLEPTEAPTTQALLGIVQPTEAPTLPRSVPTVAAAQPSNAPLLPDTAISTPLLGVAVALFGIGLACHSARRLRTAGALVVVQGKAIGRLASLARAAGQRQRVAAHHLGELHQQSVALTTMLDEATSRSGTSNSE